MSTPIQEPTERAGITIVDDNGLCSSSQNKTPPELCILVFHVRGIQVACRHT